MRVQYNKKTKDPTIYIVESTYNKKTKKKSTRLVENLGKASAIKRKYNKDPFEWAKDYANELKQAKDDANVLNLPIKYLNKLLEKGTNYKFNVGYLFLQKIYYELGIDSICKRITKKYKFKYDFEKIFKVLIFMRVISPASKIKTAQIANTLVEEFKVQEHHVYRALDIIAKESDFIQSEIYKKTEKVVGRNVQVLYFDCSNMYFESDVTDGFREYGYSKENQRKPIVGIALFLDADGIPLAVSAYPGNQNEQLTIRPLEDIIMKDFGSSNCVICSDAGLNSDINKKYHSQHGNGYVSTQPIKKLVKHLKDWAIDTKGWKLPGSNKLYDLNVLDPEEYFNDVFYKERWKNENGIEERIIASFSFKYMDFKRKNRKVRIEKAEKIVEKNKKKENEYIKYITYTNDGEIADNKKYYLDIDRITEDEKYDGFYAVTTNLNDSVQTIIDVNKRRWEIEESFKILKSNLDLRPVFVTTEEHITAHVIVCFIALLFIRILEKQLDFEYNHNEIIHTLRDMQIIKKGSEFYASAFTRTDLTDQLQKKLGLSRKGARLDRQFLNSKQLKTIITKSQQKNRC